MVKGNDVKRFLKQQGIDTRKLSVTVSYGGYSESINVKIKDMAINMCEVNKLVKREYQVISYDEHVQGEILQGGNTFVFVNYDEDTKEKAILQHFDEAKEHYEKAELENSFVGRQVFENDEIEALFFFRDSILSLRAKSDDIIVNQRIHVTCVYDLAETLTYLANGLYETQKKRNLLLLTKDFKTLHEIH